MKLPNLTCPTCGFAPLKENDDPTEFLICAQGHRFGLDSLIKGHRRVIRNKVSDLGSAIDDMKLPLQAKLAAAGVKNDMLKVLESTQDLERLEMLGTWLKDFEKGF